jgi:hypothetical protein
VIINYDVTVSGYLDYLVACIERNGGKSQETSARIPEFWAKN